MHILNFKIRRLNICLVLVVLCFSSSMACSSGEEDEYEYEEVEVEEEVDEDEYEEVVEEVGEEEPEKLEEEEEEPEEDAIEEEEVEYEEVEEEEEYEEVEEEIEVTDDEAEIENSGGTRDEETKESEGENCGGIGDEETKEDRDRNYGGIGDEETKEDRDRNYGGIGDEEMKEAAAVIEAVVAEAAALYEEKVAVVAEEEALEQAVVAKEMAVVEEEAKDESIVGSSDSPVTEADQLLNDVKQGGQSIAKEECLDLRLQDTVNSEVAAPLDIRAAEAGGYILGSLSPSQQNKKGKEVLSIDGGSPNLSDKLKSAADPPKIGDDTVEYEQGLVKLSPPASPVKDEKIHGRSVTPVATSEKHVSAPDDIHDKLHNIETMDMDMEIDMDMDETPIPSQKEDLQFPSSENMDQKALRYCTPQIRPRSLSTEAECESVSKRSAMVCEYFAKGWCIKGSSCRFLHKRDQVDHARGHVEGDMLSTKAEICPSKDSGDIAGASTSLGHSQRKYFMTNSDDMLPISTGERHIDHKERVDDKNNFHVHERDFLHTRPSISSQRSPSSINGSKLISRQTETDWDMLRGKHLFDDLDRHNSSVPFGGSTFVDNFTPGNGVLPRGVVSYAMLEESVAMRRQYTLDLHSSPIRGFSTKSSSYVGNHSLLDDSSLKDMLISYKHKRKFTPYNWEPSVPFRPSHFITSFTKSSSNVQYDPLQDSIDQSDRRHGSFHHSSYGETQGLTYQQAQNTSIRNSLESHKRLHSDSNYKDFYNQDKDAPVVEAESAAISATGAENKNISDEGNAGVTTSVKDVLKATKSITDENSSLKIDDSGHKRETGRTIELDEGESKAIRIFRTALIDFVKELMKPVWHEGRLSKDVYKVIVQKAEDKILSSLPSNEVPNTPESIKQYLSSSRPNMLRLIQAYVDKYGKF